MQREGVRERVYFKLGIIKGKIRRLYNCIPLTYLHMTRLTSIIFLRKLRRTIRPLTALIQNRGELVEAIVAGSVFGTVID